MVNCTEMEFQATFGSEAMWLYFYDYHFMPTWQGRGSAVIGAIEL